MDKPTVFFSHSSKDASAVLIINKKLSTITGGVLRIFQSSDGQSIPFGRNWLHKIEEGLNQAATMFVFVTPNSIASNWIYFEAGFAYAKGIEVIPVGFGIDISLLKAPLNLLQGFNVTSSDGLNNFISIINKKFDFCFCEKFDIYDYQNLEMYSGAEFISFDIKDVVDSMDYQIRAEYSDSKGEKIRYSLDEYWGKITTHLNDNGISYACDEFSNSSRILVYGIKIIYTKNIAKSVGSVINNIDRSSIAFTISPYNFKKSFDLMIKLALLSPSKKFYLRFNLNDEYSLLSRDEHIAAVLSTHQDEFGISQEVGDFIYLRNNISFSIYDANRRDSQHNEKVVLGASFDPQVTSFEDVVLFFDLLRKYGVIYTSKSK